jgi:hypothetical protein
MCGIREVDLQSPHNPRFVRHESVRVAIKFVQCPPEHLDVFPIYPCERLPLFAGRGGFAAFELQKGGRKY